MTARLIKARQLSQGDWPEIMDIEKQCFRKHAWLEMDFRRTVRRLAVTTVVAEVEDEVVGYIVFERHAKVLEILNLAVHPKYRRNGVGRELMARCKGKFTGTVKRILADVSERSLAAQLFLSNEGFVCVEVLKGYYDEEPELDCYCFEWWKGGVDAN